MKKKKIEPAFPQPCTDDGYSCNTPYEMAGGGISKREYFAIRMMQGIISNSEVEKQNLETTDPGYFEKIAALSVECADNLIEALEV